MTHALSRIVPLAAEPGWGSSPLIPILIVAAIFYFLVIRPQSRERKEREAKIQGVQKHTKVITNAGIHGTVVATDEDTVTLRVDEKNNVRIKFSKAAIWQVLDAQEGKTS